MNSRERVIATINHKEPDRIPIDLGGMRSTGIMAIAYEKLKKYLGIYSGETRVYDILQQLAQPEEEILKRFHVDTVDLGRAFLTQDEDWVDWDMNDGIKAKIPRYIKYSKDDQDELTVSWKKEIPLGRMPKSSYYVDQIYWPLGAFEEIPEPLPYDLGEQMWDIPTPPGHLELNDGNLKLIGEKAKHLFEKTEYAVMMGMGCSLMETGQRLRGMENFLCDLACDKAGVERLLDKLTENYEAYLKKILPVVGPYVQILVMADDLGSQNAPLIAPETYKEIFLPRHKYLYEYAKKMTGAKIFLHCCGSIHSLIPYLIEAGVDIINPVQTTCTHMDPQNLKREFGKDIVFWGGGCNTQRILPDSTPFEIEQHVKEQIEVFAPGGGFVFNQIHNIMANVPPENIVAMFDAAYKYGDY